MSCPPTILIFCGPNGAGKSTLRRVVAGDGSLPFVNADDLAKLLFGPEHAAQQSYTAALIAEAAREILLDRRISFSFETVLSDPAGAKVRMLAKARETGFRVVVHFVGLDSAGLSRARVFQRVEQGGHDVPDDKIAERFPRVLQNLVRLVPIADELTIYDNSSAEAPFRVLARLEAGRLLELRTTLPTWIGSLDLAAHRTALTRLLP